jgi:TolA-binding protein
MRRFLPALVAAAAVLTAAACASSASSPPARSTPVPPAGSATSSAPTATPSQGAFARNEAWFSQLRTSFAAIQTDTEKIKDAAGRSDLHALPALCTGLKKDAVRVDGAPAAPDPRVAAAVAAAMSQYKSAADSCLRGDYGAAADGINAGAHALQQANAVLTDLAND